MPTHKLTNTNPFRIILSQQLKYHSTHVLFTLPVIILKCLVPQQQVPEAIARRKWRHLCIHLSHLKRRDIQNNARVTAVVLLHSLSGGPAGWGVGGRLSMSLAAVMVINITTLAHWERVKR